jgi:hypothetical protein
MAVDEQIFVPDIGFRPAETMIARVPVTRAAEGLTVTVDRAVAGPGGVNVVLTITGAPSSDRREMPRFATDTVSIREPDGRVVEQNRWNCGAGRISGPPASPLETIRRTVSFAALTPGLREAELTVSGVTVPLTLEPGSASGVRSHALEASVDHHGITVAAQRIAFSGESTALQFIVRPRDERGAVDMIGMSLGPDQCDVGLRDDAGRVYGGQRSLGDGHRGHSFTEVAIFPALPADVRAVSLAIETVCLTEQTEDLTLPVGFDGEITLGGLTGRAKVVREDDERRALRAERLGARMSLVPPGWPPEPDEPFRRIEIECGEGPWLGDRRLIRPGNLWLSGRTRGPHMSFDHRGWVLSVPDPTGEATEVTISSALVQYRGPWTLEIALPERKEV